MNLDPPNNLENRQGNHPVSGASPNYPERPRKNKPRRVLAEERKRAVRACDRCRKLKEKCEGGVPCRRCLYYSNVCEFNRTDSQDQDDPPRAARPRISKSHVTELSSRCFYMEQILKVRCPDLNLETEGLQRTYESLTQTGANLVDTRHLDLEDEDDLISLDEEVCTIDPVQENVTHYSGEFSYWNFSMRLKRHIDDRISATMFQSMHGSDEISGYWRAEKVQSGLSNLSTIISCFPPRHVAEFLADIFFKYAQTNYFLVDKSWSIEKINTLYSKPENLSTKDAPAISIVLTIFAIGTQYVYLDSTQRNHRAKDSLTFSEDEVGKMFYQQAVQLLPEIIELSSLESVQACLLFGVYTLPLDASGLAYVYLNLAIRLAMQNGMHRQYTGNALSTVTIETRNCVWWSAYTLDRKINIFHGRPLSLSRSDVEANLPTVSENYGENGEFLNTIHMATSIRLVHYLEEFLLHMTTLRTLPKQTIPNTLSRLMDTKKALAAWWESLPEVITHPILSHGIASWRAAMHVRLEYCLVRLFVGRPFLLRRSHSRSRFETSPEIEQRNPTTNTSECKEKPPSRRLELVNDCVQAALDALDICLSLRDNTPGLARACYIEYSSCRASLLVLIAFSIQDETCQFHDILQRGLDMICEMSAAGDSARSEVSLIESLERALSRLQLLDSQESSQNTKLTSDLRYDSFKSWESMWKATNNDHNTRNNCSNNGKSVQTPVPSSRQSRTAPLFSTQIQQNLHNGPTNVDDENSLPDVHLTIPNNGEIETIDNFSSFYSTIDLDLFSDAHINLGATGTLHPESEFFQDVLRNSEFVFNSGFG
ncbi:fungal-specific transcription factor domain-containing protein [Talaromyces proteolyticus]|uniref:Fungal-specific transcription factor domain-containing protein n=1 Tax=Talaromyces proteolyticus TaxID=1131652 RepID=A0AAD4Q3M8_9EURO|nr:fungal-specific transcription factor domain-containing protein [Talaromyces proteolyticus]KAH8701946.1 fungal-specific transcription factor domain-containing protein [Talaromyces proteolyticus]